MGRRRSDRRIHNNAFGPGDVEIFPASNDTWWGTGSGMWKVGGSSAVSINYVLSASAPGESLAHELTHLIFDARDEYEERAPGCGSVLDVASCPDLAAIDQDACIMDQGGVGSEGEHSEYCWGHGDPSDLMSIASGNHDATGVTEQSSCRAGRSCWDQVVWAFPNTILKPAAAPDPEANGAVVNPTTFVETRNNERIVLVLDESGSMALESPTRMERLKVAAKDFVNLAESGTELGVVSFSNDALAASGRAHVNIAPLGANRSAWLNPIDAMAPFASTNIGAGLEAAKIMIDAAGGVTANTFIVLMTDGLNNMPSAGAAADLTAKISALLAAGIPVFVTCTGGDLGLQSQCAEIAAGTGGLYVDSANPSALQASFVHLKETAGRRQRIASQSGNLKDFRSRSVYVEKGSVSATFTLVWESASTQAYVTVIDPNGVSLQTLAMPQGRYLRVKNPKEGTWQVRLTDIAGSSSPYTLQAFSLNADQALTVRLRKASVRPGEPIYVYGMPRSYGGPISHPTQAISAQVRLPDGSLDYIQLTDRGRAGGSKVDDMADDGVFTGVYTKTSQKGAYTFVATLNASSWFQSGDIPAERRVAGLLSPRLVREGLVSGAVADPNDVEKSPEDNYRPNGRGALEPGRPTN
jgi:Mg-chelatase subunit ChlD